VNGRPEVVPGFGVDGEFEAEVLGEARDLEPLIFFLLSDRVFQITRIQVHPVQRGVAILVEPERGVVGHGRLVWRRVGVVVLADGVVWALVATVDEPRDAGRLSRASKVVSSGEGIALILAQDSTERPPDIAEARLVGVVVEVVVDGLAELVVFVPRRDRLVRAGRRPINLFLSSHT